MEIREFDFVKKAKGHRGPSDMDLTISTSENGGGYTYFTVRNNMHEQISPETNCFVYAISGTRIYFKEASRADGYAFTRNSASDRRYVSFGGTLHHKLYEFCKDKNGDYEIVYDAMYKLYFVETALSFTGKHGRTL